MFCRHRRLVGTVGVLGAYFEMLGHSDIKRGERVLLLSSFLLKKKIKKRKE